MKKFYAILFIVSTLNVFTVSGQSTANYTLSTVTTGSLALDKNSNTVDMTTGTTQLVAASQDATVSSVTNIGFDFYMYGNRFTQFSASADGMIGLGGSAVSGTTNGGASTTTPKICAMGGDLYVGASGKVHYKLVGTSPNRCLVVEFSNMAVFYSTTAGNAINTYQVRLYETTGVIEFVYGQMYCGSTTFAPGYVGFSVGSAANTNASMTTSANTVSYGATFNTNSYTAATNIANLNSASNGSRRVYTFTPPTTSAPTGLTFTNVLPTSYTLNWTNNGSNRLGNAVYYSTDGGTTYNYLGTYAASATSLNITGMTPSTSYMWRIYSISEGYTGTALNGTQSTTTCSTYSGTMTVGPTGTFPTLSTAISNITSCGYTGNIILELQSTYTSGSESFPITFPSTMGTSLKTVTIRPASGATNLTITSSNTTATIDLNGADYITFDGRPGGAGVNNLTISNTSTATGGCAFRLINDALNNTFQYITAKALYPSASSGVFVFSTGTASGNSNNTITNCNIDGGAAATASPTLVAMNGIYSAGSASFPNSTNSITNNNIYDYYNAGSVNSIGIFLSSNSPTWTITGNNFYQTNSRSGLGTSNYLKGISIATGTGGYTINSNVIGTNGSGGMLTNSGGRFTGIELSGSSTVSNIQGNTINNINWTTASGANTVGASPFNGIIVTAGSANIGSTTANTIGINSGAATSTSGIYITSTSSGTGIIPIYVTSTNTVNIQNNIIGAIGTSGTGAIGFTFYGIYTAGAAGIFNVSSNVIGNSTADAIRIGTSGTTTTGVVTIYGINLNNTGLQTVNNNTLNNITAYGNGTTTFNYGIASAGSTSTSSSITSNTLSNITTTSAYASGSFSALGIVSTPGATTQIIKGNDISAIRNTYASGANAVGGIYLAGTVSGDSVYNNKIYDITAVGSGSPTIYGIYTSTGGWIIFNNMVSITNASNTNATNIYGIVSAGGATYTQNVYFNSVYLGGSNASGALTSGAYYRTNAATVVNVRNNIFVNTRTGGTGGQYAIINNYTTTPATGWTSNYNVLNSASSSTIGLWGSTNNTFAAWQANGGDANGVSGITVTFSNTATGNLHLNMGTTPTAIESGAVAITGFTKDIDDQTRPGGGGTSNGGGSAPDIGADEIDGVKGQPAITLNSFYLTGTSTNSSTQCTATGRDVSVDVSAQAGTITTVNITYNNGAGNTTTAMTGSIGGASGTFTFTIPAASPANTTVTWSITATNSAGLSSSYSGTSYQDSPNTGMTATASASPTSVCSGSATSLSVVVTKANVTASPGSSAGTSGTNFATGQNFYGSYWGNGRQQWLIKATELTAAGFSAGNFNSLSINVSSLGSPTSLTNFTIKMANTSATTITTTFLSPTFSTVWGPTNYTPVSGANTHTFVTPFTWDGTSNVVIEVCHNNQVTGTTSAVNNYVSPGFACAANIGADGANTTICTTAASNTSLTSRPFFGFVETPTATPTAYSWSDGTSIIGTSNPQTANPTNATAGNITVNYTATVTVNSCPIISNATPVTVYVVPTAPTGTGSSQCGTQVPTASVADVNGYTTPTFKWYDGPGAGATLLQTSTSTTYTTAVGAPDKDFYVSVINPTTLCESGRTQVHVTISTPDAVTANANGSTSPSQVCPNTTVALTAPQTGSTNNYTFTWTSNNANSGITTSVSGQNVNVTPTAGGTYAYTVTAVDGSCTATSTVNLTVKAGPTLNTPTATPSSVCSGGSVTLNVGTPSVIAGSGTVGAGGSTMGASSSVALGSPFEQYDEGGHAQYLIKAANLTSAGLVAGNLTSLAFNVSTKNSSMPFTSYTIKLASSALTTLSGWATPTFTQVYQSATTLGSGYSTVAGANTFAFGTGSGSSSSFTWDGSSNILVDICYANDPSSAGTYYSSSDLVTATASMGYNASQSYGADNSSLCGTTTGTPTAYTSLPVITFGGQISGYAAGTLNYSWSDGTSTVLSTNTGVVNPVNNGASNINITYTVTATDPSTTCSTIASVATPVTVINSPAVTASNISAVAADACPGGGSVVTVSSTTLASGTYTVTYNVSGTNTVSSTTATMVFTAGSPGTGTFTTANLATAGTANVVNITLLASGGGCNATVAVSTPTFGSNTVTWTGAANTTDWATAGNWSCPGVPTATTNVIIATATYQPVISAAANCNNITLNSGTTLAVNSSFAVAGNWTNNGSTVSGSGTVTMSNAAASIAGSSSTTFPALTITGYTVQNINTSVTGDMNISGVYEVTPGATAYTLTVGGNFNMTGTAQIGVSGASATAGGTVTVAGNTTINTTGSGIFMQPNSSNSATNIFQTNGNASFLGSGAYWIDFGSGTCTNNEFRVKGNLSTTGSGSFYTTSITSAKGIVFNGSGTSASPQTLSYGSSTNSEYTNYVVNSGTYVKMLSALSLGTSSLSPVPSFTVSGTLDCGNIAGAIKGGTSGTFTLASGATLVTANANGVVSGTTGSISNAVGTRTFNNAANYVFNGTVNQTTNFTKANMGSLTVSNTGATGSNTVTLDRAPTMSGALTVTNGILDALAFQVVGNASNLFTLASGTKFRTSGLTTANFPSTFTNANCVFDVASTFEYYGATPTVKSGPTYGNLMITTSGSHGAGGAIVVAGDLTINSPATFAMAANSMTLSGNFSNAGTFSQTTGTTQFIFNKNGDQTVSGAGSFSMQSVTLNKTSVANKVICNTNVTVSTAGVTDCITYTAGTWEQSAGTLTFSGTNNQTVNSAAGKLMTSGSGSINFGASALCTAGTLLMNSTGTMTVGGSGNRLETSGTGIVQLSAGTVNIGARIGNTTTPGFGSGLLTGGTLIFDGATINVPATAGNLSNASQGTVMIGTGTTFSMTAGALNINQANQGTYTGNSVEIQTGTISGGTITLGSATPGTINFLTKIDVPVNNLVTNTGSVTTKLVGDLTVAGILTMTSGNIDARSNTKTLYVSNSATGAIVRTAGMVDGNLKRAVAVTGSGYLWPVGFTTNYLPLTYNFSNLTSGDLNVIANAGDPTNIATSAMDPAKNLNAYWTVTASNSAASNSFSGTYTYPSALLDAGVTASSLYSAIFNSTWSYPATSGTPTTTSLSFTGADKFGEVGIANCKPSVAPSTANASSNPISCGDPVTLTQSLGSLGTGAYWQWYTDATFTTTVGGHLTDASATLTINPSSTTTYYVRAEGGDGPCSVTTAAASVTVTVKEMWVGTTGDWFTASNWCSGAVPTSTSDIIIPSTAANFPVINSNVSGNATVHNITIQSGASVTVNGTGVLALYGSVTNSGTLDLTAGTLQLSAPGLSIGGSQIVSGSIKNLIIAGGGAATITAGGTNMIKVTGAITFGNGSNTLNTNDNITFVSNAAGTGYLGDLTNNGTVTGNSVSGKAIVEKYIKTPRKWQYLTADNTYPSSGTATVQNTWMESQAVGANTGLPGYGMWFTGSTGQPNFDATTAQPTMKWWNGAGFTGITSVTDDIHAHNAYMTYVRGDRSNTGTNGGTVTSVPTVLRTTGNLNQGNYPASPVAIPALNNAQSFGNPYASAIDLRKITTGATNSEVITFYTWDPNLTGTYGLGAYQTITGTTGSGFIITPGGGSYTGVNDMDPMNTIESGQAFYIQGANVPLAIQFNEKMKTPAEHTVSFTAGQEERIGGVLLTNSSTAISDGFMVRFANGYTSTVDNADARKMTNTSENVSVKKQNTLLAVEYRKPVVDADTVFINMAGIRVTSYTWRFKMENMDAPNRVGFLVDKFTNTQTPLNLNGTNTYDFTVPANGPANAADRFMIVFGQAAVVPVKIVSINAYREKANIRVDWKVTNEINVDHYTVERSPNGVNFSQPSSVIPVLPTNNAGGNAAYTQLDIDPLSTDNYYRIRGVSVNGHVDFSAIVKVGAKANEATIAVQPNPVKGKLVHLVTDNMDAGNYRIQLVSADGRAVFNSAITLSAGRNTKDIPVSNVTQGEYTLILYGEKGEKKIRITILD